MKRLNSLNSLIPVEEKLLEADYFACRLSSLCDDAFRYELNAFLSAARSVTFLLQKEMGAALLRRRPKGLLPAARQELLDPSRRGGEDGGGGLLTGRAIPSAYRWAVVPLDQPTSAVQTRKRQ